MNQSVYQEIQRKTQKLTQLKLRYNDLVKSVDEEFTEQIAHFNEKKIHIPLDIAKPILNALKTGNIKDDTFISNLQQFSELINFFSDSDVEDFDTSLKIQPENIQYNSKQKSALKSDDSTSLQNNSENLSDESGDVLNNFDSVHLNMKDYIEANYNDEEDFNDIQ